MIEVKFEEDHLDLPENLMYSPTTPQKSQFRPYRDQDSTKEKLETSSIKKFRKSVWTRQEDDLLRLKVNEKGATHWAQIASFLPNRSGKQCRERWHNHLRDGVTKSNWTMNQYWLLALCVRALGKKWSAISQFIRGRSDNTIKNQWNCKMKPMKEHFQAKINRILKNSHQWKSLSEDQQILLNIIAQKGTDGDIPLSQTPAKFLQEYCQILETGIQQYQELKRKLSSSETTYLQGQIESQDQEAEAPGQLSAAISAEDEFFCQSQQQNPIMPKSLFH